MKIPVHNDKEHPIYVGTSMILPGETRHFDAHDPNLPAHLRPAPAIDDTASKPEDAMADMLQLSVKEIVANFDLLKGDELDRMEAIENAAESPRKTLLSAISEEKLRRAAVNEGGDTQEPTPDSPADPAPADEANG